MKLFATSCLLAAIFALPAFAETTASPTISHLSNTTPMSAITNSPVLELRQVAAGLADPAAALTAATAMGPVTNYEINSQIGPSQGAYVDVVYTQKFAAVPDQWPSAKAGVIGLGGLAKRAVEAMPTVVEEAKVVQTGYFMQPVVVKMVTEVVTVPVRRVTSVMVIETVTMGNFSVAANGTAGNGTASGSNGTTVASMRSGTFRPLFTASGTMAASMGVGTYRPPFTATGR